MNPQSSFNSSETPPPNAAPIPIGTPLPAKCNKKVLSTGAVVGEDSIPVIQSPDGAIHIPAKQRRFFQSRTWTISLYEDRLEAVCHNSTNRINVPRAHVGQLLSMGQKARGVILNLTPKTIRLLMRPYAYLVLQKWMAGSVWPMTTPNAERALSYAVFGPVFSACLPCLFIILAPIAIVLGFQALSEIRECPMVKGKGIAILALVLGILQLVLVALGAMLPLLGIML